MMLNRMPPVFALIAAWIIFSFWGVIARAITLPLPLLLLAICTGGMTFSMFFVRRPFVFSWVAFVVAAILVLDLLFLFLAFQRITFATTIAIHYAGPIIVSFLAPLVLGESFSIRGLALAIVGFAAVLVLCGVALSAPGKTDVIYGIAFAVASAFTLAGNIMFQRMYMTQQPYYGNAVTQYNLFMALAYILLVPVWPILTGLSVFPLTPDAPIQLALAFVAGILTQGLAMILFNSAIRHIDSQTVSKMAFSEVAMTILLGSIIYHENVSFVQLLSVLVIVVVVYLSQRGKKVTVPEV